MYLRLILWKFKFCIPSKDIIQKKPLSISQSNPSTFLNLNINV